MGLDEDAAAEVEELAFQARLQAAFRKALEEVGDRPLDDETGILLTDKLAEALNRHLPEGPPVSVAVNPDGTLDISWEIERLEYGSVDIPRVGEEGDPDGT